MNGKQDDLIQHYHVTTHWSSDDQAFIAEIPELAGCLSDGATGDEARQNIRVIAQEWINHAKYLGRAIPVPKSLASV